MRALSLTLAFAFAFAAAATTTATAQTPDPAPTPVPAPAAGGNPPATGETGAAQDPVPVPVPQDPAPADGKHKQEPVPIRQNSLGETVLSPRIRNVTRLHNSMPHQLVGIGLVTGLPKTGSTDRGTRQAILNVVRRLGLNLTLPDVSGGSAALVSLTCSLPPFAKQGQPLDVKIEALTEALSLRGGELLRAELHGVDGQTYVVAQGALVVPGYAVAGQNASVSKNPVSTAWVPNGGLVVREENTSFYSESGALELQVLNPSPFNAASIASGAATALYGTLARVSAVDPALVRIELPDEERNNENAIRVLNLIGGVRVQVENPVKVMIDQASGTVLAGEGVLISPCVVGLSDLTISIVEEEEISQPGPWSIGTTERVGRTRIEAAQSSTELKKVGGGATVSDLLQNLKMLSLTPTQLISVFQALDQGGFLHATLEVR